MRGLLVACLVAIAGCVGAHSVTGTFALHDSGVAASSSDCHGTGGYSDVRVGMPVTVKDASGKIIGTSTTAFDAGGSNSSMCLYTFTVPLTDSSDFYSIEVGHRGALTYSADELAGRAWFVAFTLGSE